MKKITLEGTSFAGKTTLAKEIEAHNPERYKMVKEYSEYAGGSANFPSFPPKNKEEALRNLEFFLNLERKRHVDMESYKDKSYVMVMDRSVVSLLGFEFAQKYLGGLDIFCEAKEIIRQEPNLAPDLVVYLQTDDENIKSRLKESQRKVGDLFVDPEFNRQLRIFFEWLSARKEYPIIKIDTNKDINTVRSELLKLTDEIK